MTAAGPDFLTRNASVKRVVTTASGLQYYHPQVGAEDRAVAGRRRYA